MDAPFKMFGVRFLFQIAVAGDGDVCTARSPV
jgi:hypothetical protein